VTNEEISIGSKCELAVSLLKTFYSLHISNKDGIQHYLELQKDKILLALSKALESSYIFNKLKGAKLFRILCMNNFFNTEELKGILAFIRIEYRKQSNNLEFIRDMLLEILDISNKYPYEVQEVFAEDIQTQYNDFTEMRNKN